MCLLNKVGFQNFYRNFGKKNNSKFYFNENYIALILEIKDRLTKCTPGSHRKAIFYEKQREKYSHSTVEKDSLRRDIIWDKKIANYCTKRLHQYNYFILLKRLVDISLFNLCKLNLLQTTWIPDWPFNSPFWRSNPTCI